MIDIHAITQPITRSISETTFAYTLTCEHTTVAYNARGILFRESKGWLDYPPHTADHSCTYETRIIHDGNLVWQQRDIYLAENHTLTIVQEVQ